VAEEADAYKPFNLIVGTLGAAPELIALNAVERRTRVLGSGVHAVSNGYLDERWPKMRRVQEGLQEAPEELFTLLRDQRRAPVEELPDTGLERERELLLSSVFIDIPTYGTRASTVLRASAESIEVEERTHAPGRPDVARVKASFDFTR
jgi:uncharacterized protein with NRDE domain